MNRLSLKAALVAVSAIVSMPISASADDKAKQDETKQSKTITITADDKAKQDETKQSKTITTTADDKDKQDEIKRLQEDYIQVSNQFVKIHEEIASLERWKSQTEKEYENYLTEEKNLKKKFNDQSDLLNTAKFKIVVLTSRLIKIENEIDAISKRDDPISQNLQRIIEIDEADLELGKKLAEKNVVGPNVLLARERQVVQSKLALQQHRESLLEEHRKRMRAVRDAIEDAELEAKIQESNFVRAKSEHFLVLKERDATKALLEKPASLKKELDLLNQKSHVISERLKSLNAKPLSPHP